MSRSSFVHGLTVVRGRGNAAVTALRSVSLDLRPGEITAVVGESGSGKSTLARYLARALPQDGTYTSVHAESIPTRCALVTQEAQASLHPLLRVGQQIADCFPRSRERRQQVAAILSSVGLEPEQVRIRYPHQLSGGQAQRIAVARALALQAELVVADEPTANLDLITARRNLELVAQTVAERQLCALWVTHDLPFVRDFARRTAVLRQGEIVEVGETERVLDEPEDEYTFELIERATGRIA